MKHYNITVSGRVQGVFYRASTKEKAESLKIIGWVKNRSDGTVYIEAEGPRESLDELIDWCKQGPSQARVENVHFEVGEVVGFERFEVRR
ncbi:acylphosphatase [Fulvivirga sp. RKSG066]|uniref:acylphosphatase n=1 Tax=Fulvivirga aurantia TaxID=2529383 RepID=UPI0012BCEC92|nr:acylphosphatase [Fulvivirga aurantia]MTI21649.1 acylphosphatase [Fulvivirga aurantia]